MKKLSFLYCFFVTTLISLSLTGCSNDNKDDEPQPEELSIVGTWISNELADEYDPYLLYTLCFKKDGSGWMHWSDDDNRKYFDYVDMDEVIYFDSDGETWRCRYKITNGNKLTIFGCPWGEEEINILHLTRQ